MFYDILGLILFIMGIVVIYNRKIYNSILLSFVITIISFTILIINKFYFFAVVFAVIDIYTKIYLLMYFINKKSIFRSVQFKRRKKVINILGALVVAIFFSVSIGLKKEIIEISSKSGSYSFYKYELNEIITLAIIICIFTIAGYVTKSKRWKKLD
jgi:hypothetical protein